VSYRIRIVLIVTQTQHTARKTNADPACAEILRHFLSDLKSQDPTTFYDHDSEDGVKDDLCQFLDCCSEIHEYRSANEATMRGPVDTFLRWFWRANQYQVQSVSAYVRPILIAEAQSAGWKVPLQHAPRTMIFPARQRLI
jgi:hypothetical protein